MTERVQLRDAGVRIDSMPASGRDIEVSPDAAERAAIALGLGVTSIDRLAVKLHAVKFRGGIRVSGRLTAVVTQPSVVTLEPLQQEIGEPIDRIFLPGEEKDYADAADAEVFVDLEGDDLPDHFDGKEADLSDLIVETLALAIDLYPRGTDESLEVDVEPPKASDEFPFAVLKALKDKES